MLSLDEVNFDPSKRPSEGILRESGTHSYAFFSNNRFGCNRVGLGSMYQTQRYPGFCLKNICHFSPALLKGFSVFFFPVGFLSKFLMSVGGPLSSFQGLCVF